MLDACLGIFGAPWVSQDWIEQFWHIEAVDMVITKQNGFLFENEKCKQFFDNMCIEKARDAIFP